jgi:hypothetical protein
VEKNKELLEILSNYAKEIATVDYSGDIHARYSNDSQDDIATGIRNYYEEVSRVLQSS